MEKKEYKLNEKRLRALLDWAYHTGKNNANKSNDWKYKMMRDKRMELLE